jgi:hypothetical protein
MSVGHIPERHTRGIEMKGILFGFLFALGFVFGLVTCAVWRSGPAQSVQTVQASQPVTLDFSTAIPITPPMKPVWNAYNRAEKDIYDPNDSFTESARDRHIIPPDAFPNCDAHDHIIGYWKPYNAYKDPNDKDAVDNTNVNFDDKGNRAIQPCW